MNFPNVNPALAWNTPFNFAPGASAMLSSGFGGAAGAAGAGAGAASGLAGGASGLLGAMGGPAGLGIMAGTSLLGGLFANRAASASAQAAKKEAKRGFVSQLAGQEFLSDRDVARQMGALSDRASARKAGLYGPEDFQNLLTSGLSTSAARRELYSPIFRGAL
jgi:hypothetical protein